MEWTVVTCGVPRTQWMMKKQTKDCIWTHNDYIWIKTCLYRPWSWSCRMASLFLYFPVLFRPVFCFSSMFSLIFSFLSSSVVISPVLYCSLSTAPFCSALFWSREGLLARVTLRRLIDPSGCRVDGKHMGSLHSTQKQLLEPSFPMEKTSTEHHAETWQDKSRSITVEQTLCCTEDWVCTGGFVCIENEQCMTFQSVNLYYIQMSSFCQVCVCVCTEGEREYENRGKHREWDLPKIPHMNNARE